MSFDLPKVGEESMPSSTRQRRNRSQLLGPERDFSPGKKKGSSYVGVRKMETSDLSRICGGEEGTSMTKQVLTSVGCF